MRKRIWSLTGILAAAALILSACGGTGAGNGTSSDQQAASQNPGANKAGATETYKIGAMYSITGAGSYLGTPAANTVKMYVDWINKKGGINGHKVEAVVYDTESDESKAVLVAKRLIEQDKVLAIVGPIRSSEALAVKDLVQAAGVSLIASAASTQIVNPVVPYVFKSTPNDMLEVKRVLAYLKAKNLTRVAVLNESTDWGVSGKSYVNKFAKEEGITIVAQETYNEKEVDLTPPITKALRENPQAIIAWGTVQSSSVLARNAAQLGVKMPIVLSSGAVSAEFPKLAGNGADISIAVTTKILFWNELPDSDPQKPVLKEYFDLYKAYNNAEPDPFGAGAWDGMHIIAKGIEAGGTDRAKLRSAIESVKGFIGTRGTYTMTAEDHSGLGIDALAIVQVKDGKWTLVK